MTIVHRWGSARLPILLATLAVLAYAKWYPSQERVPETFATTPAGLRALHSMQVRVQTSALKVSSAVVAVENAESASATPGSKKPRVFQPLCSGVIITADGLVLSVYHVSHQLRLDGEGRIRSRQPGERTTVILSDGRELEAELLGANETFDLSLLRLPGPGPYPYAPLAPTATVKLGDWVLKLGHPIGYRRDRPPVVRLGRVLFKNADIFVSDCLIMGGDSGGPFFDLDGQLVGISGSSSVPGKLSRALERQGSYGPFSSKTNRLVQEHLGAMRRKEIAYHDQSVGEALFEGYRRAEDTLPPQHWTQGGTTAKAFNDAVRDSRRSLVTILDENDSDVMYGTIVESDGWVLTLASLLPAEPKCRLSPSQVLAAKVVGMNPAFDLALLKIAASALPAIEWSDKPPMVAGMMLAAAGTQDAPLAVGVVSVPQRDLPGPFPSRVSPPKLRAKRPNLSGKQSEKGYSVIVSGTSVADAGINAGDVILSIDDRKIHDDRDLLECVRDRLAGERVTVRFMRGEEERESVIRLDAEALIDSKPYADYPTLFEHDLPLSLGQCGGPVVDLDGKAVGITMYRGLYGCMAIPGDCIKRLLPELKSGGLADIWIKPPPSAPDKLK